jgi:hypothetical protein
LTRSLKVVYVYELNKTKALRDLAEGELVLVFVPKTPATHIIGMVADAPAVKAAVPVGDLRFELGEIERASRLVNTRLAHFCLNFEHQLLFRHIGRFPFTNSGDNAKSTGMPRCSLARKVTGLIPSFLAHSATECVSSLKVR